MNAGPQFPLTKEAEISDSRLRLWAAFACRFLAFLEKNRATIETAPGLTLFSRSHPALLCRAFRGGGFAAGSLTDPPRGHFLTPLARLNLSQLD